MQFSGKVVDVPIVVQRLGHDPDSAENCLEVLSVYGQGS